MGKARYKVGDKVRVLDGSNIEHYAGGWVEYMERYVGKTMEIESCLQGRFTEVIGYKLKDSFFMFDERGLELVE